ncbi:hypothetical protein [Microbacterium telephonicum]|uniref:Uncharacterized protein n=1 Tax=Microbacterium telephonicum TaxID=1714841 RepID=A0A498CB77_9MICO|nr:hypothetical protein [Microbacterium telephonicum]RLK52733.1 hypothetical protein C7474_0690 [Microbacterium telephonicum]
MGRDVVDGSARYRHLEPPIPFDQMVESVDVSERFAGPDDGYREQEWLIRHVIG